MGKTKTGKPYNTFYKNDVALDNPSYTGIQTSVVKLIDGLGNNSALGISDDAVVIKAENDNTTGTLVAQNSGGSNILAVDTTNSKVLVGASQVAANTQYAYFGVSYQDATGSANFGADTHYAIPFNYANFGAAAANITMGSSTSSSFNDTNPAATLTISTTAMDIVTCYWYVMDNITIDSVKWLHAADTATGEATAAHLMAYTVDIANGSTGGDLSSGVVVADGATITNAGYEQIYYQSMTIQSADVDAGKVILFTFASDTINSDYTINATVKYHVR